MNGHPMTNIFERIKALDEERHTLIKDATDKALAAAQEAVQQLNALGYEYRLVDGAKPGREPPKAKQAHRHSKGGPCPVCNVTTNPHHDGRSHKSHPEPFTTEEMVERGYTVV